MYAVVYGPYDSERWKGLHFCRIPPYSFFVWALSKRTVFFKLQKTVLKLSDIAPPQLSEYSFAQFNQYKVGIVQSCDIYQSHLSLTFDTVHRERDEYGVPAIRIWS